MKYSVLIIGLLLLVGMQCASAVEGWQSTKAYESFYTIYSVSPVVDSTGTIYTFFSADNKINYAKKNETGIYVFDTGFTFLDEWGPTIKACIDSSDVIHVSVFDRYNDNFYLYYFTITNDIPSSAALISSGVGGHTAISYPDNKLAIDVDSGNNPWIAFACINYSVYYKWGGSWYNELIHPSSSRYYAYVDLKIKNDNTVSVTYNPDDSSLYYYTRTGSDSWTSSVIMSSMHPHPTACRIIFTGEDETINVISSSNHIPFHAIYDYGWVITINSPGWFVSLDAVVDSSEKLYIFGADDENGRNIWYSRKDPLGSWSSWEVITDLGSWDVFSSNNPVTGLPVLIVLPNTDTSFYIFELLDLPDGCVDVSGDVYYYNATKAESGIKVALLQDGEYYNTTTNATGGYFIDNMTVNLQFSLFPEKTGFNSTPINFTPLNCGTFIGDLVLIPSDLNYNSSAIGGIVYQKPFYEVDSGLTVAITNGTWSNSTTTNNVGYYFFSELNGGEEYTLTASAPKHSNQSVNVTAVAMNFTQQDFILNESFTLTVQARDIGTTALISDRDIHITLSSGMNQTTSNGTAIFSGLSYASYDIDANAADYYPGYGSTIVDDDKTAIVYLQPSSSELSGPASNYIPHPVRFTYVDAYGNPITGATVTANAQESTNPWGWLSSVFGFNTNLTDINTTLSGTTGHDGTLSFLMVETVQYRVHCTKPSAGIDHTVDIYPKESEYFIRIGSLPLVGSYPTYSLNATTVGGNVTLFGNYTDTSGSSSGVRFIVRNSTSEVYNTSVTLTGGSGSASYAVNNTRGDQYTFGITAEHTTHGTIQKWIDITLKGTGRMIDFGSGWTDFMYLAMSLAGIFLVAGCFGEIDVRLGAIFIPITGGIFTFIGWMGEVYGPLITIAGVLGALYYMRSKAGELDK